MAGVSAAVVHFLVHMAVCTVHFVSVAAILLAATGSWPGIDRGHGTIGLTPLGLLIWC